MNFSRFHTFEIESERDFTVGGSLNRQRHIKYSQTNENPVDFDRSCIQVLPIDPQVDNASCRSANRSTTTEIFKNGSYIPRISHALMENLQPIPP